AEAAAGADAQLVVAAPAGDRAGFRRRLSGAELRFLEQRGHSFGERLEDSARQAALLGGLAVVVGGDVAPCPRSLREAFALLEEGADAVIAPAPDGGISLVALADEDIDLLRELIPRRSDVFTRLCERLRQRGRRIGVLSAAPDVDGRRALRSLVRVLPPSLRRAARLVLSAPRFDLRSLRTIHRRDERIGPLGLRAPPAAA
ncbi:MAG: DUF2064 domain-containing protein, partial [Acidobacteriota bacterium]